MITFSLLRLKEGINPVDLELPGELPLFRQLEVGLAGSGSLTGTVEKRGDHLFLFHLSLKAPVRLSCRRCLETFVEDVRADFMMVAMRRGGREIDHYEEEDVILLDAKQNELDVEMFTREYFLLNLPRFSLCRVDCRGICPGCGVGLNKETCRCVG